MMPLRASVAAARPDMQLYRKVAFGRLAEFFVLDTRQYRTDQPNGDGDSPLERAAPGPGQHAARNAEQRDWLESQLGRLDGTWNVLAQQVMMGDGRTSVPASDARYSMDQWPGYAHERMRLMQFLAERQVPNPVVLTGDIHSNWVNDLRVDDRRRGRARRGHRVRRHVALQRRQRRAEKTTRRRAFRRKPGRAFPQCRTRLCALQRYQQGMAQRLSSRRGRDKTGRARDHARIVRR